MNGSITNFFVGKKIMLSQKNLTEFINGTRQLLPSAESA